jgi:hypothetical protein
MPQNSHELARRLADRAEAVCRHYLSNGRRVGRYWLVGNVRNAPGRSMYVRLRDSSTSIAGKWTDAATGEHGDLLDVIRESCGLIDFRQVMDEARAFLGTPFSHPSPPTDSRGAVMIRKSPEAARRLFEMSSSTANTVVEAYLAARGIVDLCGTRQLRFHPRCYHSPDSHGTAETWPAMIAAVTDLDGTITGVHRTWLDPRSNGKAPLETPRRALGDLYGNAVRFGVEGAVMAAGEGIETVLSLRQILPCMPMLAALSATHLAAIRFPSLLHRLYIIIDNDRAGRAAARTLAERARANSIQAIFVSPRLGDFNEDLLILGADALRVQVFRQMEPGDAACFMAAMP